MNIMESIMPMLGGGTLDAIGRTVGESSGATRRGLQAILPTSIAGLADFAGSEKNARELNERFRSDDYPRLDPADTAEALAHPEITDRLTRASDSWVARIFGSHQGQLGQAIGSYAGISSSATSKLTGLVLPMILGVVGKHAVSGQLDAQGLSRYLGQQKSLVTPLVPRSVGALLGIIPTAARARSRRTDGSWLPWALGGLAAFIGVGWLFMRRPVRQHEVSQSPPSVSRTELRPVAGQSVIQEMDAFLNGKPGAPRRFSLEGVELQSGATQLTPPARGMADELVTMLQHHPGAKLQIVGFGAAPLAHYLTGHGIDGDRITAVGRGGAQPGGRVEVIVTP